MNAATHRPVVAWLQLGSQGPHLEGQVCSKCEAVFLGPRAHCSRCHARDALQPRPLAQRGRLYAYSIVHRSFPGVVVPYVSAIVDLDGGGTVKGNLIGIPPDPVNIRMGMPVDVVFKELAGRADDTGKTYVSYFFQPAQSDEEHAR
jgi:uncharacterized protein